MPKKIIIFLIIPALFLLLRQDVFATTILSPVVEMEVEPGQTQEGILKIFNETEEDLTLISSLEPFAAGGEAGSPRFAGEAGQPIYLLPEEKDKFLQWFKLENESILIKPRQLAVIPFSVEAPLEAPPGGYYAAIFWQKESAAGSQINSGVGVNSKVGTLVLLKVKGDLQEKGEIAEFRVGFGRNYFFGLPVDFIIRFANSGNVHLAPAGEIELKSWLGKSEKLEFNPAKGNVLPGSIRKFEILWGNPAPGNYLAQFFLLAKEEFWHLSFGRYTATLSLSFGTDRGQKIYRQLNFWVIPVHLIAVLLASIFILVGLFIINTKVKHLKRNGKKQ